MNQILVFILAFVALVLTAAFAAEDIKTKEALVNQLDNEFKNAVDALEDTYRTIKADIMGNDNETNIMRSDTATVAARPTLRAVWFALIHLGIAAVGAVVKAFTGKKR